MELLCKGGDIVAIGRARALPYSWAEQEQAIGLLQ
jgi:hypothetical protein